MLQFHPNIQYICNNNQIWDWACTKRYTLLQIFSRGYYFPSPPFTSTDRFLSKIFSTMLPPFIDSTVTRNYTRLTCAAIVMEMISPHAKYVIFAKQARPLFAGSFCTDNECHKLKLVFAECGN